MKQTTSDLDVKEFCQEKLFKSVSQSSEVLQSANQYDDDDINTSLIGENTSINDNTKLSL